MEYYVYWLLKSPCLEVSGDGKYGLFLSQKVNRKMIFADYWKILVLNFSEIGNTVFFEPKSWWEDDIYWLPKSSCFELFAEEEYGLLLSQKVDEKIIFTDYWKVLILNFSEMWNTVFFWAKMLMERWYLLYLFGLSMIFQDLRNMVFRAMWYYNRWKIMQHFSLRWN